MTSGRERGELVVVARLAGQECHASVRQRDLVASGCSLKSV